MKTFNVSRLSRRDFVRSASVGSVIFAQSLTSSVVAQEQKITSAQSPFKLKFAPHVRHFAASAGPNILDQIRYAHELGFTAWEDNGMPKRDTKEQKAIGKLLQSLDMEMGVFVAYGEFRHPTLSGNRFDFFSKSRDPKGVRELLVKKMQDATEIAKRCGARWCTIVPGTQDPSLLSEYQTRNAVENLKYMAEVCEKTGLVMVLEPLNYINHPNCFLQRISHAYQICKMVDSPSCKILDDLYHQQITEGNLINNMISAWDEIAYIQLGDVPGRKQPGTGEINYKKVLDWIYNKGYRGILGMEHGIDAKGVEGEKRLIEAYRRIDLSA